MWREYSVKPDGVENDVGDRIKWTIAMAGLKEASVVERRQAGCCNAGNSLEIEAMDSI